MKILTMIPATDHFRILKLKEFPDTKMREWTKELEENKPKLF